MRAPATLHAPIIWDCRCVFSANKQNSEGLLYMMQGCCTPPLPPHGIPPPLACQVGSRLVWPGCVPRLPGWSCLAWSPPPPVGWGLWSFWLAPPRVRGQCVPQRYGMVAAAWGSSNVIVKCLAPSPLWACGRFGWPRPACVGQCVLQRYGMVAAAC